MAVVKSEVKTFFEAYPNGSVWSNDVNGGGYDVVLMGGAEPLKINVAVVRWTAARAVGVEFLWIDPPVLSGLQRYLRQCGNPTSPLRADRRKE